MQTNTVSNTVRSKYWNGDKCMFTVFVSVIPFFSLMTYIDTLLDPSVDSANVNVASLFVSSYS